MELSFNLCRHWRYNIVNFETKKVLCCHPLQMPPESVNFHIFWHFEILLQCVRHLWYLIDTPEKRQHGNMSVHCPQRYLLYFIFPLNIYFRWLVLLHWLINAEVVILHHIKRSQYHTLKLWLLFPVVFSVRFYEKSKSNMPFNSVHWDKHCLPHLDKNEAFSSQTHVPKMSVSLNYLKLELAFIGLNGTWSPSLTSLCCAWSFI